MKKKSILFGLLIVISFIFTMKVNAASSITCTPTSVYVGDQITCSIKTDEEVTVSSKLELVAGNTTLSKDGNIVYKAASKGNYEVEISSEGFNDSVTIKVSEKTTTTTTTTTTKAKSSNAYLSSITIDGEEIEDFSKNTTRYFVEVENDVTKISIDAKAEDALSEVEIDGPNSLDVGENEYTISVTSEDNTTKFYKVIVTRLEEEESSNTRIKNIKIRGYKLDFNKNSKTFYLNIDKEDTELDITVTLNDDASSYEIEGNENLEDGSVIKIVVTAEDGSEDTYRIIIEKKDTNYMPFIIGGAVLLVIIVIVIVVIIKKKNNKKDNNKKNDNKNKAKLKKESVENENSEDDEKTKQMPPISDDAIPSSVINTEDNISDDDDEDEDVIHIDNDEEEETRILSYAEKEELKRLRKQNDDLKSKIDEELGKTTPLTFNDDDDE